MPQKIAGISRATFLEFVNSAFPGETIIYFTGHSLGDADPATQETAKEARERFAKGEIELLQRRLPGKNGAWGPLDYLAIKRKEVRVPCGFGREVEGATNQCRFSRLLSQVGAFLDGR